MFCSQAMESPSTTFVITIYIFLTVSYHYSDCCTYLFYRDHALIDTRFWDGISNISLFGFTYLSYYAFEIISYCYSSLSLHSILTCLVSIVRRHHDLDGVTTQPIILRVTTLFPHFSASFVFFSCIMD